MNIMSMTPQKAFQGFIIVSCYPAGVCSLLKQRLTSLRKKRNSLIVMHKMQRTWISCEVALNMVRLFSSASYAFAGYILAVGIQEGDELEIFIAISYWFTIFLITGIKK
jgi:hypothetical protein